MEISMSDMFSLHDMPIDLEIDAGRDFPLTKRLHEIFQFMKSYSTSLQELEKRTFGSSDQRALQEIVDKRNFIQHSLLCLPSVNEIPGVVPLDTIHSYEIYRIAALIYSTGVIFPLPYDTSPLPKLVEYLKCAFEKLSPLSWKSSHRHGDLIWALTIGGIAALHSQTRSWFSTRLHEMSKLNKLQSWDQLRQVLERFVWLHSACDIPGQQLWNESIDAPEWFL